MLHDLQNMNGWRADGLMKAQEMEKHTVDGCLQEE